MAEFTRTVTVDLKVDEVSSLLRAALGLPHVARVNFKIGSISHGYDDRYDSQGCTGISITYTESGCPEGSQLARTGVSPSQFESQERR